MLKKITLIASLIFVITAQFISVEASAQRNKWTETGPYTYPLMRSTWEKQANYIFPSIPDEDEYRTNHEELNAITDEITSECGSIASITDLDDTIQKPINTHQRSRWNTKPRKIVYPKVTITPATPVTKKTKPVTKPQPHVKKTYPVPQMSKREQDAIVTAVARVRSAIKK